MASPYPKESLEIRPHQWEKRKMEFVRLTLDKLTRLELDLAPCPSSSKCKERCSFTSF